MSASEPFGVSGVITMKMISSTSNTSTIGVTLMSEVTLAASFRFANAMEFVSCVRLPQRGDHLMLLLLPKICSVESQARRPSLHRSNSWVRTAALGPAHAPALQEVVDQFARGIIHLHVDRFHAAAQIVAHHDGRHRHDQADG